MNMNIFAPILIILFIVIMISMFMFKIMKKTVNKKGKYSYGNRVRWIVAGYISLLLICGMVVTFSSAKNRADFKTINIDELDKESAALDNAAVAGKIDTVDKKYIEKKWSFDYQDQKLNVVLVNGEFLNTQIFVERKKTNDHKIEAISYRTRSSVNEMDISKRINPTRLELAEGTLSLRNPKKTTLEFSVFNHVFAVNQFTGGDSLFSHHSSFYDGQSILYMRIPKDLELINKSDLNIQFVK
ncbi:hypothetical protein [Neobacillus drentensis]|uniref:hypothetical protein n=1 Tax=Neobacillus drentensis TaxID=220684 RepID=UPI0028667DD9|nr:hypothetical protein [Neobacillus drentensis]MDR7238474.1 heme/copper-type cytochrome/quinol oxidase subunit 2 [Neobacillus drentensis]